MAVARELDDITRSLVRHRHEHPPARDVNQEHDRRMTRADRVAGDFARVVGSWTFIVFQVVLGGLWLVLNSVAFTRHWDAYPYQLLNLIFSLEAALGMPLVLMALNRIIDRGRLTAQQDYEESVKAEEEVKAIMTHLEVQDEVMLQVLHRLERSDRELRKIARRVGVAEEPAT